MTQLLRDSKDNIDPNALRKEIPARFELKGPNRLGISASGPAWLIGLIVVVAGVIIAGMAHF